MTERIASLLESFARTRTEGDFRTLYDAATPAMFGFALRLSGGDRSVAEDVVQEAWFRAIERVESFDATRPGGPWLHGFVVNCWRERARVNARDASPDDHDLERLADTSTALWSEGPVLARAISALPDGFRAVLVMHDIEGYTHTEIAGHLGIEVGTSKSQLSRARAQLRRVLSGSEER